MSSLLPSSPAIQFSMDDRDLDDAELWAVIDSAAASRSRKPVLAIKPSNYQFAAHRNPRFPSDGEFRTSADGEFRTSADGEVVHDEQWSHRRPPKTARMTDHHRMVVVKNPAMAPVIGSPCPSPPGPGRYLAKEVSPVVESPQSPAVDLWRSGEKENLTSHSLSGRFPSVSTFKQYQNAAMAILEKTDYT